MRCVSNTLEELVLPDGDQILDSFHSAVIFGQAIAFPKLRVWQGSIQMLFGKHLYELDFNKRNVRNYILRWSEVAAPRALERLVVKTLNGKLPSGLAEAFVEECGWVFEGSST